MTTVEEVENTPEVVKHARRRAVGDAWGSKQVAPSSIIPEADVGECILLFGMFCNGKEEIVGG